MESLELWQIWLIAAVIFLVVEMFSATFVFLCFCIGCLGGALMAYFDLSVGWHLLGFSAVTLVSFFTIRPFMLKYAYRRSHNVKINVDALAGSIGRVVETIDEKENTGRIFVNGDDWRARSENEETIPVSEKVEVIRVDSTTLIVKHIKKEN
jgi:membrane protein implicated in regulation of membrane protease activity